MKVSGQVHEPATSLSSSIPIKQRAAWAPQGV